jgi:hypothetical protein
MRPPAKSVARGRRRGSSFAAHASPFILPMPQAKSEQLQIGAVIKETVFESDNGIPRTA